MMNEGEILVRDWRIRRGWSDGAYRVVLEHVGHVVGGDEGVIHGDHLDVVADQGGAHDEATDATEPVNAHADLLAARGGENLGQGVDDGVLGRAGHRGDAGGAPVDGYMGVFRFPRGSVAGISRARRREEAGVGFERRFVDTSVPALPQNIFSVGAQSAARPPASRARAANQEAPNPRADRVRRHESVDRGDSANEAREGRVGSPIGVGAWDTFRGSFSRVNFRALPVGRDAPDGLGGADALAREDGARGDGGGGGRHGVLFVVGAREVRGVSETGETRRIGAAKSWGKDLVKKKGSKRTSRDSIHVKKRSAGKTERPENVGFCCLAGWL